MMACWINRNNGYALISDSGAVLAVIEPLDNQIPNHHIKRLYKPTEWFRIDVRRFKDKPPDQKGA